MKYQYAVVNKLGADFTIIRPVHSIPPGSIDFFVRKHGRNTVIFHPGPILGMYSIESVYPVDGIFSTVDDISNYPWKN